LGHPPPTVFCISSPPVADNAGLVELVTKLSAFGRPDFTSSHCRKGKVLLFMFAVKCVSR